jgi:hypothetical protein
LDRLAQSLSTAARPRCCCLAGAVRANSNRIHNFAPRSLVSKRVCWFLAPRAFFYTSKASTQKGSATLARAFAPTLNLFSLSSLSLSSGCHQLRACALLVVRCHTGGTQLSCGGSAGQAKRVLGKGGGGGLHSQRVLGVLGWVGIGRS